MEKSLVVLVHGFGSNAKTWDTLVRLFRQDPALSGFEFDNTFSYPTAWFNFNPIGRIPRLRELGDALAAHLNLSRLQSYREVVLIGHSQGGLVIQSYLASKLIAEQGDILRRISQVIMIATPNLGSTFASGFRNLMAHFFSNPQERTLGPMNADVSDLRHVIRGRVMDAEEYSATHCPIPFTCFGGMNDQIVPEASAKGEFSEWVPIRGHHLAVLKPSGLTDENYRLLADTILNPPGHKAFFELDSYEMDLTVEPRTPPAEVICEHGTHKRSVVTDNVAHLSRSATFSRRNRRYELFSMGYGTRADGFVRGWGNVENEASSDAVGAWEDHGHKVPFEFRPKGGHTYTFDADIYRGYDAGCCDIHFHLKPDRHYRTVRVGLDLSSYVRAGWEISEPLLYRHAHDPGACGEVCKRRVRKNGIVTQPTGEAGKYAWEFQDVKDGVIEVAWEVAQQSAVSKTASQGK